jgi:hypothetical protein
MFHVAVCTMIIMLNEDFDMQICFLIIPWSKSVTSSLDYKQGVL